MNDKTAWIKEALDSASKSDDDDDDNNNEETIDEQKETQQKDEIPVKDKQSKKGEIEEVKKDKEKPKKVADAAISDLEVSFISNHIT